MVLTVALEKEWKVGKIAHVIVQITFDSSYAAGGESLDLSAYMKNIWFLKPLGTEDVVGYCFAHDDTDLATAIALIIALICENTNVADAKLIEASGDLQTLKARVHAFGDAY